MFKKFREKILRNLFLYAGCQFYTIVDIFTDKEGNAIALTFSNSQKFIDKVSEIEID